MAEHDQLPREPLIQIHGETIDPETATAAELVGFGKRHSYPYVFEKGQAKQVVEEAEQMLKDNSEDVEEKK